MKEFKWAVVGTGYIAGNFAEGLALVENAKRAAVTGLNMELAGEYAEKYGFEKAYDDFDAMLAEVQPDVVYVAVPNSMHFGFVMKALEAGINVLCEKPMPDNMKQLTAMMDKAKKKDVFLMEGVWSRCFPAVRKAHEWLAEIGPVRSVHAAFGIKALEEGWQPWKRSAKFSAGAIRDVGIYVLSYAFFAFQQAPKNISSSYVLEDGTDMHQEILLDYGDGRSAMLTDSFLMTTEHHVMIYGETGAIKIGEKLWMPNKAELYKYSDTDVFTLEKRDEFDSKHKTQGFQFEIMHVQDCIAAGKKQSDYYSLDDSIRICTVIDKLRADWGVVYPTD